MAPAIVDDVPVDTASIQLQCGIPIASYLSGKPLVEINRLISNSVIGRADRGDADAMLEMYRVYCTNDSLYKSTQFVTDVFRERSNDVDDGGRHINVYSTYQYACWLRDGNGCVADQQRSVWLLLEIVDDLCFARYKLGVAYHKGLGVKINIPGAIEYYRSVFNVIPAAASNLCVIYYRNKILNAVGVRECIDALERFLETPEICVDVIAVVLASVLVGNNQHQRAIDIAMRIVRRAPHDPSSYIIFNDLCVNAIGPAVEYNLDIVFVLFHIYDVKKTACRNNYSKIDRLDAAVRSISMIVLSSGRSTFKLFLSRVPYFKENMIEYLNTLVDRHDYETQKSQQIVTKIINANLQLLEMKIYYTGERFIKIEHR